MIKVTHDENGQHFEMSGNYEEILSECSAIILMTYKAIKAKNRVTAEIFRLMLTESLNDDAFWHMAKDAITDSASVRVDDSALEALEALARRRKEEEADE